MTSPAAGDRSDTGLACLVALARVHELAVDAGRLRHEFGRAGAAFDAEDIVRAARWLGLKARLIRSRWQRLPRTPLPAIAELGGGFVLLAGVGDEEVLVQRAFEPRAEAQPRARFESAWSGRLVLVTRRAHAHPGAGRFGFAWFLPHVLEHRVYLGEVLVAVRDCSWCITSPATSRTSACG
ncbi:MAG: cysteine peptidase family C39 domain-containing protein, partial [Gammaproteobacteria bacterium]